MGSISNGIAAVPQAATGKFLFTSESVGEGHPDKIWYVVFNNLILVP